jgi:hypothetical protein
VEPARIIPQLATATYDRLLARNYNFNELSPKKKKLAGTAPLEGSDLASFIGKDVAVLVESIYDRIKEMQTIFQVDPSDERIDFNRRVINLHKRILLLMLHLRGVLN